MNALHELKRTTAVCYEYEWPNGSRQLRTTYYKNPVLAAVDHNQREIVKLLLSHGAETCLECYEYRCCDYGCASCRGDRSSYDLLHAVALRRPSILGFIREPAFSVVDGINNAQKVFRALLRRKEFASEYVAGQNSDTMLHAAVAVPTRNNSEAVYKRKLIWLCLVYNQALIDKKGKGGVTPVELAVGGHHEALQVILQFCYAVRSQQEA
jgi:hypothetical protein